MYRRKIGLAIVLIVAGLGLYFTFVFYRVFFASNTAFNNPVSYVFIPSQAGIVELLSELEPLLKSTEDFKLVAEKKGYDRRVRGGKYALYQGMNNNEMINVLRSQPLAVKVTFNNMERLEDLAGRVAAQIEADSVALLEQFKAPAFLKANGYNTQTALAMYIPNTYELFWNTTPQEFQKRMLKESLSFWNERRREAAKAKGLTPVEVVTLASIVHKETNRNDERPTIAQVYLNRLKRRMKLDADPTVVYAIKQTQGDFDLLIRRVLQKDLKISSPYNTYKYRGLPPGPIMMPDISAIDAVLFSMPHNYLYFVVDPSQSGKHDFSRTLREHNRKAQKYYRWLNQQRLYR
ncbi:MAG: endolytic transglycosylase MltG [Flavobacteriaceae bacterium]